ncbi:major facilitator superfamily domain-containing protein [Stachybotrys elegans]|uniref:Major facilitator superfamily domain-containing protein n=1 Tax=Stachybotrys elegans TaxID=80388 RepID=A0A8K0SBB8_9HYPO|nr:major facilitator superfamily domain-containing protein [Stachybotrys elegans]
MATQQDSANNSDAEKRGGQPDPAPPNGTDTTELAAVAPKAPEEPVDGGTAAWLTLLGAWCCSFCSPGWINSVGSFQEYYANGPLDNYSSSTIAWIPSLQVFFLFGLGPIVGRLYDLYGPKPLLIGGSLLHVFGLMMASLARTYYQFLLTQGVVSAIGVACLYSPALAVISTWFVQKRGLAMGIMATGSSVGGVIFPIMISRMIRYNGYGWALRTAGFLILGLQIVAILTVRPRVKPVPRPMAFKRFLAPFSEFNFVLLLAGIFLLTFGIYIPLIFLALQALEQANVSTEMANYLIAILNAASLFGRLLAGIGADKIGRWNMFIIACALSGVSTLAIWIPADTEAIAIGFAVTFGFASGAFVSLVGALPISVSPPPEIGYRMGVVFLVISLPALTMAPTGGAIIESSSTGWRDVKIFAGVMAIAGSAVTLLSRWFYTDKKLIKAF